MVLAGAVSVTRVWRATGDILLSLLGFVNPFFAVFFIFFEFLFRAGGAAPVFLFMPLFVCVCKCSRCFDCFFFAFFHIFSFFG